MDHYYRYYSIYIRVVACRSYIVTGAGSHTSAGDKSVASMTLILIISEIRRSPASCSTHCHQTPGSRLERTQELSQLSNHPDNLLKHSFQIFLLNLENREIMKESKETT